MPPEAASPIAPAMQELVTGRQQAPEPEAQQPLFVPTPGEQGGQPVSPAMPSPQSTRQNVHAPTPQGPSPSFIPPPWTQGFDPEDLKVVEHKKWETPADVVRAVRANEKFLGAPASELVRLPPQGATREELDPLLRRLGVPEKPDGYNLGELLSPEKLGIDIKAPFMAKAYEVGITESAAREMAGWYEGVIAQQQQQVVEAVALERESATNTLRREWGQAFESKMQAANQFAKALGLEDDVAVALEQALGPERMARSFAKWGERIAEHRVAEGTGTGGFLTPSDAQAKIVQIQADPAFMDARHVRHGVVMAEYMKLLEAVHGAEPIITSGFSAT